MDWKSVNDANSAVEQTRIAFKAPKPTAKALDLGLLKHVEAEKLLLSPKSHGHRSASKKTFVSCMHGCTMDKQRTALASVVNQTSKWPSFLTLCFFRLVGVLPGLMRVKFG